ncbi:MAG TPA: SAM-dependent methyltransferase [Sporichthyaceae bacterium]
MAEPLTEVLAELRGLLLDPGLMRAVASGRRHRGPAPDWRRVELRPVQLKGGPRLQEVRVDERTAHTRNLDDAEAAAAVDELLAAPFGNWHVAGATGTVQMRVTKKGEALVHRSGTAAAVETTHDRSKRRLLAPDDPLFTELGADAGKRRQVDAFLRLLAPELNAVAGRDPLHVVDLGCGHAYLSFAAQRYLSTVSAGAVTLTGVDLREAALARNTALAARLGVAGVTRFVAADIAGADVAAGDVVLALHACDTATDEALARAVGWATPLLVAAPCCHHETAATLRTQGAPAQYGSLLKHGILRERLADVLTDALRALLLRLVGYRVDVLEFVSTEHTARNVAIRAVRTGAPADPALVDEYRAITTEWGLRPRLAALLSAELTQRHGGEW